MHLSEALLLQCRMERAGCVPSETARQCIGGGQELGGSMGTLSGSASKSKVVSVARAPTPILMEHLCW